MSTAGELFTSWRRAIAIVQGTEARFKVFGQMADDLAGLVAHNGLDKAEAVDALHDTASAHGFFGCKEDEIQLVISDAFTKPRQPTSEFFRPLERDDFLKEPSVSRRDGPASEGDEIRLEDFVAYMPMHTYVFIPSREIASIECERPY